MEENKMTFEEKLQRLDEIVKTMKNRSLALEESLALFKEGNALIKELDQTLQEAETSIQSIVESDENSEK